MTGYGNEAQRRLEEGQWTRAHVRMERGNPPAVSGSAEHRATGRKSFGSGSLRSGLDALGGAASSEELLLS